MAFPNNTDWSLRRVTFPLCLVLGKGCFVGRVHVRIEAPLSIFEWMDRSSFSWFAESSATHAASWREMTTTPSGSPTTMSRGRTATLRTSDRDVNVDGVDEDRARH